MIKGKKLLIIGASVSELSLVRRAQQLGAYTIVTDRNHNHIISPCKDIADEYWDIDWSDIDALETKCKMTGVDGVISGYSEFRVENNIKLCKRLGLPCYITEKQLAITRDKKLFKEQCRVSGVPTIKEYSSVESVDSFPVIVKPTDRAGSIGVSIANNADELKSAYEYAMEMSVCKKVIIEQFITDAVKFDVYYSIINGEITLLSASDVINAKNNALNKVVQSGWPLPSRRIELFKKNADADLRRMISDMDIKNGYIFFSGFADEHGWFAFFECGFRLCGGHLYNYFPLIGHINNMDLLIYYALTGNAECVKNDVKPAQDLKCIAVNLYAKKGTISSISGMEEVERLPDCKFCLTHAYVGEECADDNAILSKIGMAYFCNENVDCLVEDAKKMYELVSVLDQHGSDMIYDRMDLEIIREWWNN